MKDVIGAITWNDQESQQQFKRSSDASGRGATLVDEFRAAEEERRLAEATQRWQKARWVE